MGTNDGARRSAALVIAAQYSSILQILTGYVIFSDKHNVILLFRYIYIYIDSFRNRLNPLHIKII